MLYHKNFKQMRDSTTYFSDSDFKDFMILNKKCTAKPYSFLATDVFLVTEPLGSDNHLRFRCNILE